MPYRTVVSLAAIAVTVAAGACNRQVNERRETARTETAQPVDRTAEQQRQHQDEIARLDSRVADIERKYTEKESKVVSGRRTATAGLQEEVKEDVTNVRKAVNDLSTTNPENWWDRHEQAMRRTVDDIEADVQRLAGKVEAVRPQGTTGTTPDGVSNAPFESRRDRLVADIRARADAMERALDNVKAKGARETEINDTKARVKKLRDDADRLASAKADDWWDVSKARVTDYVDRVQASVDRLDDNKR
jgi:hypothetical protein